MTNYSKIWFKLVFMLLDIQYHSKCVMKNTISQDSRVIQSFNRKMCSMYERERTECTAK